MGNLFVYLLFLLRFVSSSQNNGYPLLDLLYTHCSASLNCESINTTIKSNISQQACCGRCSCNADCGHNQSCCLQEENEEYTRTTGQECIEPLIGDKNIFGASKRYAFMMWTQCPDKQEDCKYKNGSLNISPVSTSSSETFLNEDCAICNNAGDLKRWPAEVKIKMNDFLLDVWQVEEEEFAARKFHPPSGSVQTSCIATQIEEYQLLCSNALYIHLCKTLNLPFTIYSYIYRNIFCFFCEYNRDDFMCAMSIPKQDTSKITMLIDDSISKEVRSTYLSRINTKSDACPDKFIPHPAKVF